MYWTDQHQTVSVGARQFSAQSWTIFSVELDNFQHEAGQFSVWSGTVSAGLKPDGADT